jgi:hypothetical protein
MTMLTLVSTLAISSCAGKPSANALPPLVEYTPTFQKQLKAELPTVRACCPNTNTFVKDSIKLRDKVRAGHTMQGKTPFRLFKR